MTPRFISPAVKKVLEANYRKDRYPTREQLEEMSREFGERYDRLYGWYHNRRCKERKTLDIEQIESHPPAATARPRISPLIKSALEAKYNDTYYPTRDELEQMSQELGESPNRLYRWFDYRRKKEREILKAIGIESHPLLEKLRPHFSTAVAAALEANYIKNPYPDGEQFKKMSRELGESYDRLRTWYRMRREKERKTLGSDEIEWHPLTESARSRLSTVVKRVLEAKYNDNRFPTCDELEQMAQELGESSDRLYRWFFRRRVKERRMVQAAGIESHPLLENLRPHFSTAVAAALEANYVKNHYPSSKDIEEMSQELGESRHRVLSWYSTRRVKQRKVMKIAGVEESPD